MSLAVWLQSGWLVEHQPTAVEIGDLLRVVERDLTDAQVPALSSDTRLKLAYNAALQSAAAALAACGYRASREGHHYRTIQSLSLTINAEPMLIARLDRIRRKRNVGDYEKAGIASEADAASALELAKEISVRVQDWLKTVHPRLIQDS